MIDQPKSYYQQQIKDLFGKKTTSETEIIFRIVELMLFSAVKTTDLFELYELLGIETFSKLINLLDGREIRVPSKKDLEETLLAALFYYEKEIKGLDWKDIKKKYPEITISSIKYSIRIGNLNTFVKQKILELIGDK